MSSTISQVRLYAESLEDGGTYRGECPECGRKGTFTVTREGEGFVYNCYSTHCGLRGTSGTRTHPDNLVRTNPRTMGLPKPFQGELARLSKDQLAFLETKIGFQDRHVYRSGVMYAPTEDRYAFPIYAPTAKRRGFVLRSYEPGVPPMYKAITRMDCEEAHMSWYGTWNAEKSTVLVVEDIPSAVRASMHHGPVVAMCGGGIGPDYVRELAAYARNVVWAFDGDAFDSAISHHRRYSLCFDSSRVLRLTADLKNMVESDLTELMTEV